MVVETQAGTDAGSSPVTKPDLKSKYQYVIRHIRNLAKEGATWIPSGYSKQNRKLPLEALKELKDSLEGEEGAEYTVAQLNHYIKDYDKL